MRHLIDPLDFTEEENNPHTGSGRNVSHCIPMHTVMLPITRSSLHFSMRPSTRTRLSLESAMLKPWWTDSLVLRC